MRLQLNLSQQMRQQSHQDQDNGNNKAYSHDFLFNCNTTEIKRKHFCHPRWSHLKNKKMLFTSYFAKRETSLIIMGKVIITRLLFLIYKHHESRDIGMMINQEEKSIQEIKWDRQRGFNDHSVAVLLEKDGRRRDWLPKTCLILRIMIEDNPMSLVVIIYTINVI